MKELKNYEVKIRQFNGHYDVTITDVSSNEALIASQKMRLNSPDVDLKDDESRRRALDAFFSNISYILRQRTFPNDTLVYDTVESVHGKKLINPRYPALCGCPSGKPGEKGPEGLPLHLKKDFGCYVPGSDD